MTDFIFLYNYLLFFLNQQGLFILAKILNLNYFKDDFMVTSRGDHIKGKVTKPTANKLASKIFITQSVLTL